MEAGESCSQWLALAVVEGSTFGDADAAGSRRGSGGGGTGFIKREESGLHAGVETKEARVGIGTITAPFLFVYLYRFGRLGYPEGASSWWAQKLSSISEFHCFQI